MPEELPSNDLSEFLKFIMSDSMKALGIPKGTYGGIEWLSDLKVKTEIDKTISDLKLKKGDIVRIAYNSGGVDSDYFAEFDSIGDGYFYASYFKQVDNPPTAAWIGAGSFHIGSMKSIRRTIVKRYENNGTPEAGK